MIHPQKEEPNQSEYCGECGAEIYPTDPSVEIIHIEMFCDHMCLEDWLDKQIHKNTEHADIATEIVLENRSDMPEHLRKLAEEHHQ